MNKIALELAKQAALELAKQAARQLIQKEGAKQGERCYREVWDAGKPGCATGLFCAWGNTGAPAVCVTPGASLPQRYIRLDARWVCKNYADWFQTPRWGMSGNMQQECIDACKAVFTEGEKQSACTKECGDEAQKLCSGPEGAKWL